MTEEVGERERVELAVRERQLLRPPLHQLDTAVQAAASLGEHLAALVDTDHAAALLPYELACDRACARGDVEDAVAGAGGHA